MGKRLRRPTESQGARYEVAVAATMIRAGFDLQLENEKDSNRRHPEFLATHRKTGQVLAVEGKSRHLPGVLGRAGRPIERERFRLDIRGLLRDALAKPVAHPYAIFIDANMPPDFAREERQEWLGDVDRAVGLLDHGFNDLGIRIGSGFNFLAITNVPHHYGRPGEPPPNPLFYRLVSSVAQQLLPHPEVLGDIERSPQLIDRVPQEFPTDLLG
jgi:hypothetical protein